jgi:uncharacterized membrane protein
METLVVVAGLWFLASPFAFLAVLVAARAATSRADALERELFTAKLGWDGLANRLSELETTLRTPQRDMGPYRLAAAGPVSSRLPEPEPEPVPVPVLGSAREAAPGVASAATGAPRPLASAVARSRAGAEARAGGGAGAEGTRGRSGSGSGTGSGSGSGSGSEAEAEADAGADVGAGAGTGADTDADGGAGAGTAGESWERWIGVRGAAAMGAAVLVLAGLYFFKFSIDRGWLTPTLRVLMGSLAGAGCVVASELTLRRRHVVLANWLAGAGIAILYIAFWAARSVFDLVSTEVAFALMGVTTAGCVLLSVRHGSLAIAVLGLMGGFATPVALSSGSDRPLALFGYVLLLDGALLFLARRRRWPMLAVLSLAGTTLYQALWMGLRMGPERVELGVALLVVFSALFTAASEGRPATAADGAPPPVWQAALQPISVLLPFVFALAFAGADVGDRLAPLGVLLFTLSAGACFVARLQRGPWLAGGAAAANVVVLGLWIGRHAGAGDSLWPVAALVCGLALLFHGALELSRRARPAGDDFAPGAGSIAPAVSSLGGTLLLLGASASAGGAPWLALGACSLLAALSLRHASFPGREPLATFASVALGLALSTTFVAGHGSADFPPAWLWCAVLIAVGAGLAALASRGAAAEADGGVEPRARWAHHGAAAFALLSMGVLLPDPVAWPPWTAAGAVTAFAALAWLASSALGTPGWSTAATAAVVLVCSIAMPAWTAHAGATTALAMIAAMAIALAAAPLFASASLRSRAWTWRVAAMAPVALAIAALDVWTHAFGWRHAAALPASVALLSLAMLGAVARRDPSSTARGWFFGVACASVTVALGLELRNEWLTIGWAVEALALLALWRRLDRPALKYTALAHLAVVVVRLVINPAVLDYHEHSTTPVLNWIALTYGPPAMALFAAWAMLRDLEVPRLRAWETSTTRPTAALAASTCAAAGALVVFVWLNLTIVDAFAEGPRLTLELARLPARDLTISLAWAVYALALLGLGMRRASRALRWTSLGLVLITASKVFLYDLAHLGDLYRVASLVGLAASLIVISLAYQRFVFAQANTAHTPARARRAA